MESPVTTAELKGRVLAVEEDSLLLCDVCTRQKVRVHVEHPEHFCAGDCLCVRYNGVKTNSLPPQITAASLRRCC